MSMDRSRIETRRSDAAQFFVDGDGDDDEYSSRKVSHSESVVSAPYHVKSTYDQVVELLNEASLLQKDSGKLTNLRQVQELIVNKEPNLLDNFLDEMLAFQNDTAVDVKKFIISFMEEACRKDPEILYKVIGNLNLLLQDQNVNVKKKVVLSMSSLYRTALHWIVTVKSVNDLMRQAWKYVCSMKELILLMLDSENDGIRTHAVKFIESIVITLSEKHPDSDIPKKHEDNISLDQIPDDHHYINLKKLQEEGLKALEALLSFMSSSHITSVNLITVLGSLTTIAKQRPQYMAQIIQAFEGLHVNLPPTLAKSQVSSVRKNLKMQLLQLLKHIGSIDYQTSITTLLTDLGATNSEVMKNLPKPDESRKRKAEDTLSSGKKMKFEEKDIYDDEFQKPSSWKETKPSKIEVKKSPLDITTEEIMPKLTTVNVTDLVLVTMTLLPEQMPAQFQSTYTPIAAAGTDAQMHHMGRLLAAQLHAAGLGKGYEVEKTMIGEKVGLVNYEEDEEDIGSQSQVIQTVQTFVRGQAPIIPLERSQQSESIGPTPTISTSRKGIKPFRIADVTHPMPTKKLDNFAFDAFKRILDVEHITSNGHIANVRAKLLAVLASQNGDKFTNELESYIFEDLRNRQDLAFTWLYQEYANCQGYIVTQTEEEGGNLERYDACLTRLLTGLLNRPDQREGLFTRMLVEAPYITPNAVQVLKEYCQDQTRIYLGMSTLKELVLKRPNRKYDLLQVLLDFAAHEKPEVRSNSMRVIRSLYERSDMKVYIDKTAKNLLQQVQQSTPPREVTKLRPDESSTQWTEETIKVCLHLYVSLMPLKPEMIHGLGDVYIASSADVKRAILRILEGPVKGMGMNSPELLSFVESCPKGSETLVTRVIHILTDKVVPSEELVQRVLDLYNKRVSDVRFLIPVLAGLPKKKVVTVLPKLIKLNPNVVKEVFNRLLGGHIDSTTNYQSPLTPADLLVALHNIAHTECDLKTIIKATNLCFAERTVYTTEVLAVVMQQLMEITPLPTLLMRTVIQSLAMYPKLLGFVLNILQRLVVKQVWRQEKVWEGFIKCCQRTKPQSFQVMLQLPPLQLLQVFDTCPDLREPLRRHVNNLAPNQKVHLPQAVINALELDPENPIHQEALQAIRNYVVAPPPGVDTAPEVVKSKIMASQSPVVPKENRKENFNDE